MRVRLLELCLLLLTACGSNRASHHDATGSGSGGKAGGMHAGSGGAHGADCATHCDAGAKDPSTAHPASDAGTGHADAAAAGHDASATARDAAVPVQNDASTIQPAPFASRSVAARPTYMGSVDDGADCSTQYATIGFEPDDAGDARHPLFLYFVGTAFVADDASSKLDSKAALAVTDAMARRGFVALSVQYDNSAVAWLSDHTNQLACLFDTAQSGNLLSAACSMPRVDCDLGIATWGHSLGGLIAIDAADFDARVRAAWVTGFGGGTTINIDRHRLRVVNGEADTTNGTLAVLNEVAGFSDAECPDDGRSQCLRDDGSGWIIVRAADVQVSSADHCWFDKTSCLDSTEMLEPSWIDPASTKPFALERNADWVAATARRP
jgi:hypothetical protein